MRFLHACTHTHTHTHTYNTHNTVIDVLPLIAKVVVAERMSGASMYELVSFISPIPMDLFIISGSPIIIVSIILHFSAFVLLKSHFLFLSIFCFPYEDINFISVRVCLTDTSFHYLLGANMNSHTRLCRCVLGTRNLSARSSS